MNIAIRARTGLEYQRVYQSCDVHLEGLAQISFFPVLSQCHRGGGSYYIKEEGKFYARLLQDRIKGDYNDLFDFNEEYVRRRIGPPRPWWHVWKS
jgi:hypothetical protein